MQCEVLMKTFVESVSPQDSVQTAARLMRDKNIGFLPVCETASGRVVGTVTDRDITIRCVAEQRLAATRVGEVMTRDVVACLPEDEVSTAEDLMGQNLVSRIMCIDEAGHLVGIISLSDLAQMDGAHAAKTLEQVSAREASLYRPPTAPTAHR